MDQQSLFMKQILLLATGPITENNYNLELHQASLIQEFLKKTDKCRIVTISVLFLHENDLATTYIQKNNTHSALIFIIISLNLEIK